MTSSRPACSASITTPPPRWASGRSSARWTCSFCGDRGVNPGGHRLWAGRARDPPHPPTAATTTLRSSASPDPALAPATRPTPTCRPPARDRRDGGVRAGGHHDAPAGLDDPIIDGHPAGRHDAPLAPYESAPLALEALHRHPAVPAVGRLVTDPRSHRAPNRAGRWRRRPPPGGGGLRPAGPPGPSAEGVGFEPTVTRRPQRLSRPTVWVFHRMA